MPSLQSFIAARFSIILLAGAVLLALLLLAEHGFRLEEQRAQAQRQSQALQQASTLRARIEGELNSSLFITVGLIGYVSAHDLLEAERVMRALSVLYSNAPHIRNVGMAPQNVLRYVYPIAGNEAAIGMDYRDLPQQWPDIERAIAGRQTVLAGPIDLVQGGRGLVSRTPVFLDGDEYWGILSVVLDTDSLFQHVGILAEDEGTRFALRWQADDARHQALIVGEPGVFDQAVAALPIQVPGGVWELAVALPSVTGTWSRHLLIYRLGGFVLAAVIALLLYLLLEERRRVARLALQDQLTGLPNRRGFITHGERVLQVAARRASGLALVYIDLDGFKSVNDRFGHKVGDDVLELLGRRLQGALDRQGFMARIGGDEFVVLLERADTAAAALARVRPLLQAVREPIKGPVGPIHLDASLGVSLFPEDGQSIKALLNAADRKMYARKQTRPACHQ
ncbi:MAG: diguanylate cyclase domain-containing protein [Wenzhouxiangella sp.]